MESQPKNPEFRNNPETFTHDTVLFAWPFFWCGCIAKRSHPINDFDVHLSICHNCFELFNTA